VTPILTENLCVFRTRDIGKTDEWA
jgi:hypothetical protein